MVVSPVTAQCTAGSLSTHGDVPHQTARGRPVPRGHLPVSPRQLTASSSWPADWPSALASSGLTKVEPKVLMPLGCASRRRSRIPAIVCLTASGSPSKREGRAGDDLARAEVRAAIGEAEILRARSLAAGGGADRHPVEHLAELAAVGVRVHPHRAADRTRDVDPELEPGRPQAAALAAAEGRRAPPPADAAGSVSLEVGQVAGELEDEAAEARRRRRAGSIPSRRRRPRPPPPRPTRAARPAAPRSRAGRRSRPARRCGPSSAARAGSRARRPRAARSSSPPPELGEPVDVAGADRDQQVALAQPRRQRRRGGLGVGEPPDRPPPARSAAASATSAR